MEGPEIDSLYRVHLNRFGMSCSVSRHLVMNMIWASRCVSWCQGTLNLGYNKPGPKMRLHRWSATLKTSRECVSIHIPSDSSQIRWCLIGLRHGTTVSWMWRSRCLHQSQCCTSAAITDSIFTSCKVWVFVGYKQMLSSALLAWNIQSLWLKPDSRSQL